MSLLRIATRSAGLSRSNCMRCFSTTPDRASARSILDVLPQSSESQRHPSNTPSLSQPSTPLSATRLARDMLQNNTAARDLEEKARRDSYQRQIHRKWKTGDVYAPHDLSGAEQMKWKRAKKTTRSDAFDTLGINPINEYKNYTLMSEYMTEMGRVKHSKDTGLRPVNQRKIAKAIRRAVGLGLMPSVHRHPLVLKKGGGSRFF
ncbi:ribosomal protein S18 [Lophiotrema nucula]|uniref:Small ribosomal subunit protein bS18m n=1 Tax=Lophiotrema nucula TaxID=690887 RepID=A0A6A5YMJ4_9PLEO|nr:ribosomal protein S18 [Lophiotrema nucula]